MNTMKEVIMPKLGITMEEGAIHRWLVKEGGRVEKGMPLLEVESNKAVVEIEALASGVLVEILKDTGEIVPVSEVIALIDDI